jgi:hypothetical protein
MKFTFEEDATTEERTEDDPDRRKLVTVSGGSRAVAIPLAGIFIDADRNFADELEDELNLLPAPDILDDVPDDEADLRVLKRIYEKNPQVLAKFLVSIGL